MPPLKIEFHTPQTDQWVKVGQINPGDQYGSISDNTGEDRDVYYFGVDAIEGVAVIKRSNLGIDTETGSSRIIHDLGEAMIIASLQPGEKYEMTVKTDQSPVPRKIRFTHLNG